MAGIPSNSIGLVINGTNPLSTSLGGTGNTSGTATPSGSAGGDLTGSYPNPTLGIVNSNIGSFGSSSQVGTFTVNGKGLITAASNVTISGVAPGGSAGGDLTGTYPNPTVASNAITYAKFQQIVADSLFGNPTGSTANGQAIGVGSTLTFSGTALQTLAMSGDLTTPANSFVTTLATVNSNVGSFGSATQVGQFTVNAKGLVTAASNVTISGVAPGGSAGGDLSGTYPNPTVAKINTVPVSSSTVTDGQLLIGSTSGANYTAAALTGTANEVIVTNASHSITLSTPQAIGTGSSPTFSGLTLSGLTAGSVLFAGSGGAISQNNSNFFWDNTNDNLYISANSSSQSFAGVASINIQSPTGTNWKNGINIYSTLDQYPILTFFGFEPNTGSIFFDAYTNGNNTYTSSSQSGNFYIQGGGAALYFNVANGFNPGVNITWTQALSLSNAGVLNFNLLTASTALVLDGSKNVITLGYGSTNTGSTLVERDGSGNFSAGTITASLSGNATTATTATNANNIATTQVSNNANYYPILVASSTNSNQAPNLGTGLGFNPSNNSLTTTTFNGTLNGNAATATTATTATNMGTVSVSNNATYYPILAASSSNSSQAHNLATGFNYNPSTGNLSAPSVLVNSSTNNGPLTVVGGGGTTGPTSTIAYFSSPTSATAGNLYSVIINKSGSDSLILGVNKNSTTGSVPSGGIFISSYASNSTISIGRGAGNGLPNNVDLGIDGSGNVDINNGNLVIGTAGKTLTIPNGSNACAGSGATMVAGSVTVSTTAVQTGDIILLMKTANGGTTTIGYPAISISNGASFTITGGSLDTSTWSWVIIHV